MTLSRRHLLSLIPGLALAPAGWARPGRPEHCFLFIFCDGGWDTSYAFTPFQHLGLDAPAGSEVAQIGDIEFVDHPDQPEVRRYLEDWGARSCIINGIEVRSVTHTRCQRILMTGKAEAGSDDWPSILAASAGDGLLCPHLVISGPAFSSRHTAAVVRVGAEGQLPDLLSGDVFDLSARPIPRPHAGIEALGDAFVRDRAVRLARTGGRGREAQLAAMYRDAMDDGEALAQDAADLRLRAPGSGCTNDLAAEASVVFDCFSSGLSRTAIVRNGGWCAVGWDNHQQIAQQSMHFDLLFKQLRELMVDLHSRVDVSGTALSDRVTVVVVSEMGRHPVVNSWGGKDHWTTTSAMLLGGGVRGNQVIGGLGSEAIGLSIDLASGEPRSSGTDLLPGHLGATLMRIGGHDPAVLVPGYDPILAALG